ncbi:MAG: HAD family hydrolase [Candidatus Thermoplasmatota archaeon]
MIKIISFDLDGTLVKKEYTDIIWLKALPRIYSQEKNISFEKAESFIRKKYNEIGEERKEWYDINYWFNRFNLKSSWKKLLKNYSKKIELFSDVKKVLNKLYDKYDLIISSNARREFIDIELENTRIEGYFQGIFSSTSDFNTVKKNPDFYKKILKRLNVKKDEIVHIGDSEKFDYLVPKKVGITSFLINRRREIKKPYSVENLKEFRSRISKINKDKKQG